MPPDSRVHCGVVVFIFNPDDYSYLLVKRAGTGEYASDGHGTWAMPGGWIDFGETLAECAAREVKEETGCDIEIDEDPLDVVSVMSENGDFQIVVPILSGRITGEPQVMEPDKHSEVRWVSREEIDSLPLFGSTEVFFQRCGVV